MVNSTVADLLDRAAAERAAGRGAAASKLFDEAATNCRQAGDLQGWTEAVLGAASVYLFGSEPGKLPAQLYDVLCRTTDDTNRARIAAALARCWAYAGHAARAVQFSDEAVSRAQLVGDPELVADCLDAALAARWGPDDLDLRRSLADRLDEIAAHVLNPDTRLQAHLWGLQVACEVLDIPTMHRQIRALELLGEETPRALFFAASRRLMLDLLRGRFDTTERLIGIATQAAERASLADAWLVLTAMEAYSAAQSGDTVRCAAGAEQAQTFAVAEGATVVSAEAAFLWTCAGRSDRARSLVDTFHGRVLDELPRDVNWLLTVQCVLEAALFVADREVITTAFRLLTPYEGRSVINAGAVMFHGLTDDTLSRAARFLGDNAVADRLSARALATYERLGAQWWRQRLGRVETPADAASRLHLHPVAGGLWLVGSETVATPLPPLRGFEYLRVLVRRPGVPVSALDLVRAGTVESGLGQVADQQALSAYRHRLRDLDQELADADQFSDIGRSASLSDERDALIAELARVTGLGGRPRTSGSSQERARVGVKKAISTAVDRIATIDKPLAQHLRTCLHTGLSCTYDPGPDHPMTWILD